MKRIATVILTFALLGMLAFSAACAGTVNTGIADGDLTLDEDFECTITVDGGGQWADYNTTASMEESVSNPYPYNTLEVLAKEYMELHPNITIEINAQSHGGSRDSILPMLTTATAPDILYQVPTCLAEDCNQNYYAALDEYLQMPNPYSKDGEAGSEHWIDVFGGELRPAVNGHYYYASLERSVIGIVYNKTFFDEHGLNIPTTFAEFVALIEQIHSIDADVYPYASNGGNMWLDLSLESALFSTIMDEVDVLTQDGVADAQEILRAYDLGIWDPEGSLMDTYLDFIVTKTAYSGDPTKYTGTTEFINENLIMIEAAGSDINFLQEYADFETGVFTYPILTSDTQGVPSEGVKNVRRGSAGLSTGWFVTNHAFSSSDAEANLKKVNACVDFLMFLTAYSNNDRLVGDKGVAVPLSGNTDNATFAALMEQYRIDSENEDFGLWASFNPSGTLTKSFYDSHVIAYNNYMYGSTTASAKGNKTVFINSLMNAADSAMNRLVRTNGWDTSEWTLE